MGPHSCRNCGWLVANGKLLELRLCLSGVCGRRCGGRCGNEFVQELRMAGGRREPVRLWNAPGTRVVWELMVFSREADCEARQEGIVKNALGLTEAVWQDMIAAMQAVNLPVRIEGHPRYKIVMVWL